MTYMHTGLPASSDGDLMHEVVAGSQDALAALYDRHVDGVFAAARRLAPDRQVAEEVVQETFLTLWNRAELFDPRIGSLSAWLRRIARNRALDRLRAAGRRPRLLPVGKAAREDESIDGALERLAASSASHLGSGKADDPEDAAVAAWTRERIRGALDEMPTEERTVIVMAYDEDLTQSEIAGRLGWPIGTVKTRTRRALRHLRRLLAPEFGPGAEERAAAAIFVNSGGTDGSR
jgi:RNA polymerase sigma-70 factor (ECF subfamily)